MTQLTSLSRELTDDEREALRHYGADSTYLHAAAQGRGGDFQNDPAWAAFVPKCKALFGALDSAISASTLEQPSILFSGHGNGFAVRGSLEANPKAFVGMIYCYPGYISTSTEQDFCQSFLEKRRSPSSRPTLMTFDLPSGFSAIDMKHGGHFGEFEFLLGRNIAFSIIDACLLDTNVLSIVMRPANSAVREIQYAGNTETAKSVTMHAPMPHANLRKMTNDLSHHNSRGSVFED